MGTSRTRTQSNSYCTSLMRFLRTTILSICSVSIYYHPVAPLWYLAINLEGGTKLFALFILCMFIKGCLLFNIKILT
jgi:hypothetical protein